MPAILRQTAPEFTRKDGTRVKLKAIIAFCEVCNFEGAPFGSMSADGKRLWWCGYVNGTPTCTGKGNGKPTGTNK